MRFSPLVKLSPDAPQLTYDFAKENAWTQSNVHQGQRKLLMSEIQLLTEHYSVEGAKHPWLVYVGAAPGTHMVFLHKLFPHVRFSLWDGAPFDSRLNNVTFEGGSPVFELHNEFFTDDTCRSILERMDRDKEVPMLFVSDIRLGTGGKVQFEEGVKKNLIEQKQWVKILNPSISLLKFRLPFVAEVRRTMEGASKSGDTVPYMRGKIFYGIWSPKPSAETRLMIKKEDIAPPDIDYDYGIYERVLFHHNVVTRRTQFPIVPEFADFTVQHGAAAISAHAPFDSGMLPRYCRCYDCLSELVIYKKYHAVAATRAGSLFADSSFDRLLSSAHDAVRRFR